MISPANSIVGAFATATWKCIMNAINLINNIKKTTTPRQTEKTPKNDPLREGENGCAEFAFFAISPHLHQQQQQTKDGKVQEFLILLRSRERNSGIYPNQEQGDERDEEKSLFGSRNNDDHFITINSITHSRLAMEFPQLWVLLLHTF